MRISTGLAPTVLIALSCTPNQITAPDAPSTPPTQIEAGPIVLANAELGDQIEVQIVSQGCFHYFVVDVTIRRTSDDGFEATARASTPEPSVVRTPPTIGQFSLQDIVALDRYLQLYRTVNNSGYCTTHTQVRVSHVREGAVRRSESHEDTSCEVYSRAQADLPVAFNDLLKTAIDQLYADLRGRAAASASR